LQDFATHEQGLSLGLVRCRPAFAAENVAFVAIPQLILCQRGTDFVGHLPDVHRNAAPLPL
jgi:hypothetical protein